MSPAQADFLGMIRDHRNEVAHKMPKIWHKPDIPVLRNRKTGAENWRFRGCCAPVIGVEFE